MGEGEGWPAPRTTQLGLFTATPRGWNLRRQMLKFRVVSLPRHVTENVFNRRPLVATLKRLDFLHTGTWYRVGRFPQLEGAIPESDSTHWVMFVGNFNGGWEPYRDSFLEVLAGGVASLWTRAIDFPRHPGPGTRYSMERWTENRRVDPELRYFYSAYPGATSHDVRAALRVSRELRGLVAEATAHPPESVRHFATGPADLRQLIHRLQNCLGELAPTPKPWPAIGPPTATGTTSFLSIAPIAPDRLVALEADLARLGREGNSPFTRVEGTHFARLAIIDRQVAGHHSRRQIRLANSWLMVAVDIDAHVSTQAKWGRPSEFDLARYIDAISKVPELAQLWDHCPGRRAGSTLGDYLVQTVPEQLLAYRDYPAATLGDILRALDLQNFFRRWVAAHRDVDADGFEAVCRSVRSLVAA